MSLLLFNGKHIDNLKYADDTVLMAKTLKSLENMVDKVNNISQQNWLKLNLKKTKFMFITKSQNTIPPSLALEHN